MKIVLSIIRSYANDANIGPVDLDLWAKSFLCGDFEVPMMIANPGEVEKALIHEVGRFNVLVLDDDGVVVFG
jgi:hypothetical protein